MAEGFATAILTISSTRSEDEDKSGPALAAYAEWLGGEVIATEVIADDRELIAERLRHFCDERGCALVLTTGGTGFSPDDLTPEATRDVIEREAPGLPEAMRAASREHTPMWMTSRAVAGTRGHSLIVNFPGNPPAIEQAGAGPGGGGPPKKNPQPRPPHAIALLQGRH